MTERETSLLNRRSTDAIELRLNQLHVDVSDMKDVLKELTVAINRLAIVEERQTQTAAALERAFGVLEKVETRLGSLEKAAVASGQTNDWVGKAIWTAAAAAAVFVGKKVGLL